MICTLTTERAALTARIMNPLLSSVVETFDKMVDRRVTRSVAQAWSPGETLHDISVVMNITGRARGTICFSFPREVAYELARCILGGKFQPTRVAVEDALGDLTNSIVGSAKAKLNMGLNIGLPLVLEGKQAEVIYPQHAAPIRLHFQSEMEKFFIEFAFVQSAV